MRARFRTAALVAAVTFAAALAVVGLLEWRQAARRDADVEQRLRHGAEALAPAAAKLLELPREDSARAIAGWAAASGLRVTLIRADGTVEADSETVPDLVRQMENHGGRPEVRMALRDAVGSSLRHSRTTNRTTLYVARRLGPADRPAGFLRLAFEKPPPRLPLLPLGGALLVAIVAAVVADRIERGKAAAVARLLAAWAELPPGEPAESVAEEADRRFRALSEEQRRELEATRAALGEVSEGVLLLDRDGVVRYANAAATALLGGDLAVGRALVEAVRAPELLAAVDEVALRGEVRHTAFASPTGAELAVRACTVPHPVLNVAVVLRDVRGERQLERARKALVADLAHELRTPLTVLGGLAEELREGALDAAILDTIARQVRRLHAFAEDLEELAAAESGRLALHAEATSVVAVVRHVLADHAATAQASGVSLVLEGEDVTVATDPVRLGQVLSNLVDNAIRYNRAGGRVVVRCASTGEGVRIAVEDDGQGIPGSEIPFVFQRFYRVRRGGRDGSGLGLAIVKHLMEALGGTVQLRSREGEGTEVTVVLPAATPVVSAAEHPSR
jgi:two-component system phosphate regulon sensor histidine kinase PhoR